MEIRGLPLLWRSLINETVLHDKAVSFAYLRRVSRDWETSRAIQQDIRDTKRTLKRSFIPQKAFGAIAGRLWL